jgi:hypothetical protein
VSAPDAVAETTPAEQVAGEAQEASDPDASARKAKAAPAAEPLPTRAEARPPKSKREAAVGKGEARKGERASQKRAAEVSQSAQAEPGALDQAKLQSLLAVGANRATQCSKPDGPHGSGVVRVLFNPSGGILRATVLSAPFAGSEAGACVERAFQNLATPAFRGRTQSTTYRFLLP